MWAEGTLFARRIPEKKLRKNSVSLRLRETRDLFYKKTPQDDNSTLNVGDARLFPRGDVF